jgi:tetratricopeptide (TPR) repeat protein
VRTMTPAQIRDRLDERFRLLTGGSRRALERHQTLRHAVQWSFDLLSPAERAVLARCSVFAGGFSLEAAESVGAGGEVAHDDILDLLDSLARKSLIMAERSGEAMRYGLLETIRQFGEEHLSAIGESDAARLRHAQFFAQDSEIHFRIWRSPQTAVAHRWVEREMDNLRAAFRWAMDHEEVDLAARLNIGDMGRYVLREEAAGWAAETIDAARRVRHPRLTVLLTWAASCAWGLGRLEDAKRYGEEAISLAGHADFEPYPWAYGDLAFVAGYEGDLERALTLVQEGAALHADREDRMCLAHVPYFMAISGRRQEAMAATDDIVATVEEAGLPIAILTAHYGKGHAFADADPPTALAAFERVVAIARDSGNRMFETAAIPEIAILQARSGDTVAALHSFRQMLDAWHGAAELLLISHGIGQLVVLFERLGRYAAAAVLHGAIVRMYPSNPFVQELPDTMRRVRKALGGARFEEAQRRGAAMAVHETVDYAQGQIRQALAESDRAGR